MYGGIPMPVSARTHAGGKGKQRPAIPTGLLSGQSVQGGTGKAGQRPAPICSRTCAPWPPRVLLLCPSCSHCPFPCRGSRWDGWLGTGLGCGGCTHHPPAAVVVQVHQCPGVLHFLLLGIYKGFGKPNPVVDVVTAAAPVELPTLILGAAPLEWVAAAGLQVPLATCPRDGIDHSSRGDGVDEGSLPAACQGKRNRDRE